MKVRLVITFGGGAMIERGYMEGLLGSLAKFYFFTWVVVTRMFAPQIITKLQI